MLIISLPSQLSAAEPLYEYLVLEGTRVARQDRAAAALLSGHSAPTVGIIPASRLSWIDIEIPPVRQRHQLTRVIHSVLEDRLLQDLDQLHIVAPPQAQEVAAQGGRLLVAVCDKHWLRQALAPLQKAGLTVQRLLAEFSPTAQPQLHVIGSPEETQCIFTHAHGVTHLPTLSSLWPALGVHADQLTIVCADPALSERVQAYWGKPPQISSSAQRGFDATQSRWDFAQGEWAQTGWSRIQRIAQEVWQQGRYSAAYHQARMGLLAFAILYIVGLNVYAWRETQRAQDKRAQLAQILTQTFPAVKMVIDPQMQMQRELDQLQHSHGGLLYNDFEPLLASASRLMKPGEKPMRIDYVNHQLQLQGLEPDATTLASAQNALNTQRLQIQIGADRRLTISAGGTP